MNGFTRRSIDASRTLHASQGHSTDSPQHPRRRQPRHPAAFRRAGARLPQAGDEQPGRTPRRAVRPARRHPLRRCGKGREQQGAEPVLRCHARPAQAAPADRAQLSPARRTELRRLPRRQAQDQAAERRTGYRQPQPGAERGLRGKPAGDQHGQPGQGAQHAHPVRPGAAPGPAQQRSETARGRQPLRPAGPGRGLPPGPGATSAAAAHQADPLHAVRPPRDAGSGHPLRNAQPAPDQRRHPAQPQVHCPAHTVRHTTGEARGLGGQHTAGQRYRPGHHPRERRHGRRSSHAPDNTDHPGTGRPQRPPRRRIPASCSAASPPCSANAASRTRTRPCPAGPAASPASPRARPPAPTAPASCWRR